MKRNSIIAIVLLIVFVSLFVLRGCDNKTDVKSKKHADIAVQEVQAPAFDADSCFGFIKRQVEFGPRVPNSSTHTACGDWLVQEFSRHGARITEQKGNAKAWDGQQVPIRNIIAEFNPGAAKRILFAAHWDTRPYADKDSSEALQKKPIDGANDGASGVGVLLELARLIKSTPVTIGIDIILFDVEDMGKPEWAPDADDDVYTWCLGSQYWAKNPHRSAYQPIYGILLDMVGAKDARFNKEGLSMKNAPDVVNLVWKKAQGMGFGGYFQDQVTGEIIDDHLFMNMAGIRTIDIIDMRESTKTMGFGGYEFGSFHHTHKDNIAVIDKNTLKAVGQTLAQVIYNVH